MGSWGIDVVFHPDPATLLEAMTGFVRREPFSANVIAGVAAQLAAGGEELDAANLWATVQDGGEVAGLAMRTPPWHLFVSRMPRSAAVALADAVADARLDLHGVNGEVDAVRVFADQWRRRTGAPSQRRTTMRMYVLGRLAPPAGVEGEAVLATDSARVAEWAAAFRDEAQPGAPVQDWDTWARQRVGSRQMHFWRVAGRDVAMAGSVPPAAGVARVGPVYTPPEHRRSGYGTAVTAAATAAALAGGAEHVALYADLANPTSNAIYQAIGFRPDHDAEERTFLDQGARRDAVPS